MKKGIKKDNIFLRRCPRLNNGGGKFLYALAVCLLLTIFLFVNAVNPVLTHASGSAPDNTSGKAIESAPDNTSARAAVFPQLFCSDPLLYARTADVIGAAVGAAANCF